MAIRRSLLPALLGFACVAAVLALPARADAAQQDRCASVHSGRQALSVHYGGEVYRSRAYLPRRTHGRPALVLNLHGSTHTGANQQRLSGMERVAARNGFAVLAPNGGIPDGDGFSWNVPGVPLANGEFPPPRARDDIAFLAAAVRAAARAYCVDTHRVYVTGHSGGARMASALACARADLVAAAAPVSGLRAGPADPDNPARPDGSCRPSRPVPIASFHGTLDPLNPYFGGGGPYWGYSVPAAFRAWQRLDHCSPYTVTRPLNVHSRVTSARHCAGGAEVRSYVISGAGHIWPGSPFNDPDEPLNYEIRASDVMWSFFAHHRRR